MLLNSESTKLLLAILFIVFYSGFVFVYYRLLSKRDILELNLRKYNVYKHKYLRMFFGILLFLIEYIMLIPIFVLFWFFILAVFIMLLSQNLSMSNILFIAYSIVGAVRICAYMSEDLARDLAKLFPFVLLSVFLLNPNVFSVGILYKLNEIPKLALTIVNYLFVVFLIETGLRLLYLLIQLSTSR